ncbi:copper chaperone PCu(A)C [Woodsholea maritima]|uniref:copper chaperone PCu(A)C n=1 Tax=Woodsholea maritima TaxID=240237 RepID=UPI0003AA0B27|nr:copper chaperone PCu(A)C [Woodsholea maritima]
MMKLLGAGFAALVLSAACSAQDPDTSLPAAAGESAVVTTHNGLQIEGAWMRTPPGGRDMTAAYVLIHGGTATDRLIAARSDQTSRIELHTVISEGGIMQMRPVEGYDIPAGGWLELAPRGHHMMVFGLAAEAIEAGQIDVTLVFAEGGEQIVTFPIQTMAPGVMHTHDGLGEHNHAGQNRSHDPQ